MTAVPPLATIAKSGRTTISAAGRFSRRDIWGCSLRRSQEPGRTGRAQLGVVCGAHGEADGLGAQWLVRRAAHSDSRGKHFAAAHLKYRRVGVEGQIARAL